MNSAITLVRVLSRLFLLLVWTSPAAAQEVDTTDHEAVHLEYELELTKCQGPICRSESVKRGQILIQLESEDQDFAWGNEGVQVKTSNFKYYLRFKASRRLTRSQVKRALDIGFAGRLETSAENKQVTWADKLFTDSEWKGFSTMTVSGKAYSDGKDTVSPALKVRVVMGGN
jgi:hypothetical protein